MKKTSSLLALSVLLTLSTGALAMEGVKAPKQHWDHKGLFGAYNRGAVQRGFQVYKEVCSACHAMKFLSYRNLEAIGYTPDEVKAIASQFTVTDGPGEDGEMFDRNALPSDRFKSPFKNDNAARAANGGALPPDLSLVIKARAGGEDYVYGLLTGYEDAPADVQMMPGMSYNKYFPGHQTAMARPLNDGQVTYSDGTAATTEQAARDVVQFLAWASEPHMEHRKQMGVKVILFLLAFAGIAYGVKKKVWSRIS